uniref:Fusicocca-1,10(14)-diene-8beta,16-diol C-9 hydroxylase n=1 Tax=Phomopsis amygdali TaxID=1214568 RepID=FC7_PHOAM|nr:RecName: Full=Fusicocca-1,10(14)-diene-8beta,16-diol C-9 hydroxylase; AltName: Full=Cytochrome P450 monooxygenase PaP450-3; AltName: Full=Fusicoccin A biosynthetic gene clusters protein 7 [Diaporthe amygdali]BAM71032.1 fusicocca-1,10(14)-diene-8beta,16-diol C-9 hydroxylase [Diaporthe amygdali]
MLSTMDTVAALAAVFVAGTLLSRLASWIRYHFKIRKIPLAHNLGLLDRIFTRKATEEFAVDFKNLSRKGLAKDKNAFRVQTDFGEMVILGGHYAEEMKGDNGLSTGDYTKMELMGDIPGFEPFSFAGDHRELMHTVITKRLNRALPRLAIEQSVEVADFLSHNWTDSNEWHSIPLYQMLMGLVARASVSAFLGPELARNERWIELNAQYTVVGIGAVHALRPWPRFLLPLVHHFHPKAKAVRAILSECRQIMEPILRRRAQAKQGIQIKSAVSDTALDWFEEVAASIGQSYDPTVAQLTFAVAAMHSTTDHLCQILIDLRDKTEVVAAARSELVDVVTREGWNQTALSQLKLMESIMKESQRMKPINRVINKRIVTEDLHLSNDVFLPKGSFVAVSGERMHNPSIYEDPEQYDAYRFIKKAEEGPESARFSGYTSITTDSVGFGYGKHSCPGRSYVSQEMKVILSHILLKYDFRFPEGYQPKGVNNGFDSITDIMASCMIRRRAEEVKLPG